jgi:hypothetical protein
MKKLFVFFVALLVCLFLLNTNIFSGSAAYPSQGAVDVRPDEFMVDEMRIERPIEVAPELRSEGIPSFDFGSIRLKSAGMGKCTGVTLVPLPGMKVQVRAQRFTKSFWGSTPKPGKVLSKWTKVSPGGLRAKFDRAGGSEDHYRIFCRVEDAQGNRPIECHRVLQLRDAKPGHCWSGPGSADAQYAPLNMTIKNK